jgi:hypothetical protein
VGTGEDLSEEERAAGQGKAEVKQLLKQRWRKVAAAAAAPPLLLLPRAQKQREVWTFSAHP